MLNRKKRNITDAEKKEKEYYRCRKKRKRILQMQKEKKGNITDSEKKGKKYYR